MAKLERLLSTLTGWEILEVGREGSKREACCLLVKEGETGAGGGKSNCGAQTDLSTNKLFSSSHTEKTCSPRVQERFNLFSFPICVSRKFFILGVFANQNEPNIFVEYIDDWVHRVLILHCTVHDQSRLAATALTRQSK